MGAINLIPKSKGAVDPKRLKTTALDNNLTFNFIVGMYIRLGTL
jgi:hypothetical protein